MHTQNAGTINVQKLLERLHGSKEMHEKVKEMTNA